LQKKNQDGGDIRVGQKSLFYLKNSKSKIFQKVLPGFLVLSSTQILYKIVFEIFRNGGTIQDGGFLTFHFQKFGKIQ
jgi:hypothetical protein